MLEQVSDDILPRVALSARSMFDPEEERFVGGATPLAFLQAVYCNEGLPLHVRLKAAIAAAPYVHPKLAVTAVIDGGSDFAARLELARARSAKVIEARAEPPKPRPTDLRGPPMVVDRRLRRV
jgi:hypothetical protein